ncbi:MAG: pyridoxal-dependent decarboxylase, partial [bacterium]
GNIMALWIAREKLKEYGNPIVVAHYESHYSIEKACRMLGLELVKNSKEDWNKPLGGEMIESIVKGDRPIICVATVGHTSTGIIDDVKSISDYLKKSQNHHYLHLDAAVGGLFVSLDKEAKIDFCLPEVQSITFDFHKYGLFYYPSGLFLCRKDLQNNIQNKANYVNIFDDTLIGSRSGTIPAIMWANTELLKEEGLLKRIADITNNKNRFIKELLLKKITYISEERMPVVCFFLKDRLPEDVELKYRLHHIKRPDGYGYTIFFYPKYLTAYSDLLSSI